MPVESNRAKDLFVAALAISDSNNRSFFLDAECAGDSQLRQVVDDLLQRHVPNSTADQTMARTASEFTGPYEPIDDTAIDMSGAVVAGKYRLLQVIGEGGMGTVYVAEQFEPVKRRVAIKVVKAGMDSARVLARFEAERQALALMDHPNIARVFDAGATELGRPFFVMELVQGIPLTRFCDENKLAMPERLRLFIQICFAVQHAHQKGIMHRDLKPSNVLVERHENAPQPKVIDFGLAKAITGVQLTEKSLFTAQGTVAGTPLYMAPEQTRSNAVDVDTRADVYSLGVMLYELLTGTTPIERQRFEKAAFDEMLRMIREEEPPTPSSRLSNSEMTASAAETRQMEPAKLGRFVRGDLDWIVMKALSKERERRYESAAAFAKDIERFLRHEPVQAGPPSAGYRLRKFVRRNRGPVLACSLLLIALVVGIAGTTWGMLAAVSERNEKERARDDEAKQRKIAERERDEKENARRAEAEQRKVAVAAEKQALDALISTTDSVVEQLIGSKSSLGPKEKAFLESALKMWQTFASTTGEGEIAKKLRAEGLFRVVKLRTRLGQREEPLTLQRDAIALWNELVAEFPDKPIYRDHLGNSHVYLGFLQRELGKRPEALASFQRASEILNELCAAFPTEPRYADSLALCHINLGHVLKDLGKYQEAEAQYRESRTILRGLVAKFPTAPNYRKDLGTACNSMGILSKEMGEYSESNAAYREDLQITETLAKNHPDEPEYRLNLALIHVNMGALLSDLQRRPAEAEKEYHQAVTILEALVAEFPAEREYRHDLGKVNVNLGITLTELKNYSEAETAGRRAQAILSKLSGEFPGVPAYRLHLAYSLGGLGTLFEETRKWTAAESAYRDAIAIEENLAAQYPAVLEYRVMLGGSQCNLGNLFKERNETEESLRWYNQAIASLENARKRNPNSLSARRFLGNAHAGKARALSDLKRFEEAQAEWTAAIELLPKSTQAQARMSRASCRAKAGQLDLATKEADELSTGAPFGIVYDAACVCALAYAQSKDEKHAARAIELLRQAEAKGFKNVEWIKKDSDLSSLHDRGDFKQLMAQFEKNAHPKPEGSASPRAEKP